MKRLARHVTVSNSAGSSARERHHFFDARVSGGWIWKGERDSVDDVREDPAGRGVLPHRDRLSAPQHSEYFGGAFASSPPRSGSTDVPSENLPIRPGQCAPVR